MAINPTKPTVGGSVGTWGSELNNALDTIITEVNRLGSQGSGSGIPPTTVTTKGDLLVATGSGAVTRLGVGANGQVLTGDSTTATGVAWKTPAATGSSGIAPGTLVLKATRISTMTINTSATNVTLNSIDYVNTGAGFTNATGTIASYVPGIAGYYEIVGGVSFANVSGTTPSVRGVYLTQNGNEILGSGTSCSAALGLATSLSTRPSIVYCNATANLALWAYQASGSAISTEYNSAAPQWGTSLTIKYLGT